MGNKPSNPKDRLAVSKIPLSVVSQVVLMEVGVGMAEGGMKYGVANYRAVGVQASIYFDAAMRHLQAWWEGQDIDPDSGLSHVTKAITSLVVLRDCMIRGNWEDDRPPALPPTELIAHMEWLTNKMKENAERYKHLDPKHYTQKDLEHDKNQTTGG